MYDKDGYIFYKGDKVKFHSFRQGKSMPAVVISDHLLGKMIEVKVANDPFTSWVERDRIQVTDKSKHHKTKREEHKMPKTATPTAKELRKQAKALSIEGWEDMDRDELAEAIAEAEEAEDDTDVEDVEEDEEEDEPTPRKSSKARKGTKSAKANKTRPATKKAASKKAPAKASKKAKPADDEDGDEDSDNPFRPGSNLWHMTEALMKGGKRSTMVTRLQKKIDLKPRVRGGKNYDEAEEIDYRLVRVCQLLTNEHDFVIEKEGRGKDQVVKAVPPSEQ